MTNRHELTCDEVLTRLADYLEPDALGADERAAVDAHLLGCDDCAALVADLRDISATAGALPELTPSRDLWAGIAERIETPVVELATRTTGEHRTSVTPFVMGGTAVAAAEAAAPHDAHRWGVRRMMIAASLLVTATAGVTYTVTTRRLTSDPAGTPVASATPLDQSQPLGEPAAPATGGTVTAVKSVNRPSAEQTFDREIGSLRKIVDQRRGELDPATVATLEKNLKLIDRAIAESKAALAKDPASGFLMDRLSHAYDTKLQVLRGVATLPARS
jgi:hypothetical protein